MISWCVYVESQDQHPSAEDPPKPRVKTGAEHGGFWVWGKKAVIRNSRCLGGTACNTHLLLSSVHTRGCIPEGGRQKRMCREGETGPAQGGGCSVNPALILYNTIQPVSSADLILLIEVLCHGYCCEKKGPQKVRFASLQ